MADFVNKIIWNNESYDIHANGFNTIGGIGSTDQPVYIDANGHVIPANGIQSSVTSLSTTMSGITINGTSLNAASLSGAIANGVTAVTQAAGGAGDNNVATTEYVMTAVNNILESSKAMTYEGTIGVGGTVQTLPALHTVGDTYIVCSVGTYAGVVCQIGDMIICQVSGSTASDADWNVVHCGNADGKIIGPASAVVGNLPTFSNVDGKALQDSGIAIVNVAEKPSIEITASITPAVAGVELVDANGAIGTYPVTEHTKVDVQLSAAQITAMADAGCTAMFAVNETTDGVVSVKMYTVGADYSAASTFQVCCYETL